MSLTRARCRSIIAASQLEKSTLPNLFDNHPPFPIDGNFGGSAGIAEMLLQSHTGEIHLLPALPKAWPEGSVRGLCARGNCEVEISWKGGALIQAVVHSRSGGTCRLRAGTPVTVRNSGLSVQARPAEKGVVEWATVAGADYIVSP